jgi:hypothetical protein
MLISLQNETLICHYLLEDELPVCESAIKKRVIFRDVAPCGLGLTASVTRIYHPADEGSNLL